MALPLLASIRIVGLWVPFSILWMMLLAMSAYQQTPVGSFPSRFLLALMMQSNELIKLHR
jgi:hypothetical protein